MRKIKFEQMIAAEVRRLNGDHVPESEFGALGCVRFSVDCPFGASAVIEKAKGVLAAVDDQLLRPEHERSRWADVIPSWFQEECKRNMTPAEAQRWLSWWRGLPDAQKAEAEVNKDWSLDDWLYWVANDSRQWFWWDFQESDDGERVTLAVQVLSWPFAWGALRWLFKAAGASAVSAEK